MAAWSAIGAAFVAALLHVALGLPRLPRRLALVLTAALCAAWLALLWLTAWPGAAGLLPLVALVAGHLGYLAGRGSARRVPPAVRTAPASAARIAAPSAPASVAPTTRHPERTTLGRYQIDRELGRGAMGAVYLGHDPTIGRQVAIKTMALAREFDGTELAEARERFFREAETAGRLQHRDIVTIFDAGEDQELAYIAMEFLRGRDLSRHTQPASLLPVPHVLQIVARVADALAYAHSQGVVHRDVKPANVMVDAAANTVKVTDFGIARIADSSRTRTGMVLGTPSFMSPEQMAGHRVDGRSDLYSLGVMLFQLLTGQLPHRAESMARLMFEIANASAPDVRTLRPELPQALADVVALALEKRPEVRYGDGREMAKDLRAVLAMLQPASSAAAGAPHEPPPPGAGDPFAATAPYRRPD
jgi:serine/threonine-protein kinase